MNGTAGGGGEEELLLLLLLLSLSLLWLPPNHRRRCCCCCSFHRGRRCRLVAARLLRGSPGRVLSGSRRQVVPFDRREIIVRASYQPSGILLSPSSYRHGVPVRRQFTCCTRVLALLPPTPCRRYSVTRRPSPTTFNFVHFRPVAPLSIFKLIVRLDRIQILVSEPQVSRTRFRMNYDHSLFFHTWLPSLNYVKFDRDVLTTICLCLSRQNHRFFFKYW